MLPIRVSMDKITFEYTDVNIEFFIEYVTEVLKSNSYVKLEYGKSQAFVFTVKVNRGRGKGFHISYQHIRDGISETNCYSLWLKINPEHLAAFKDVFETLQEHSSAVNFVRAEIAFDIPYHLKDVLLMPKRRRNYKYYFDTTYYGERKDQGRTGYCRFYDKKKQLKDSKGIEIEGERSRIEITWSPDFKERFLLSKLPRLTPDFNKMYQCYVITDISEIKLEFKGLVEALTSRLVHVHDLLSNDKRRLKNALRSQSEVDFNALLREQWRQCTEPFVRVILNDKYVKKDIYMKNHDTSSS